MTVNDSESNGTAPPLPCDHVLFTDLDGVEGVLVDLNTRKYYQLNETASLVWRGIEARKPLQSIAQEMNQLYDVSTDGAASSVQRLLSSFCAYKLVRLS